MTHYGITDLNAVQDSSDENMMEIILHCSYSDAPFCISGMVLLYIYNNKYDNKYMNELKWGNQRSENM